MVGRVPLRNFAGGIGDLLCELWVIESMRAAGLDPVLHTNVWREVPALFGLEGAMTPHDLPKPRMPEGFPEPERWAVEVGAHGHPPKGLPSVGMGWIRTWLWGYSGVRDLPVVRPRFKPLPLLQEKMRGVWQGTGRRVLVFPDVVFAVRRWPHTRFISLTEQLLEEGCDVRMVLPGTPHPDYPRAIGNLSITEAIHLVATADLVVGNDSGPAHIAGTLDVPCVAVCGPTPPRLFFEHTPSVREVRCPKERMRCVGCNWQRGKGYIDSVCAPACEALNRTSVEEVVTACRESLRRTSPSSATPP